LQDIEFGWRIVTGSIIGFLGSAFGTVGGVGGGGIFVTMLSIIIGFDQKSATAISKCKHCRSLSIHIHIYIYMYIYVCIYMYWCCNKVVQIKNLLLSTFF